MPFANLEKIVMGVIFGQGKKKKDVKEDTSAYQTSAKTSLEADEKPSEQKTEPSAPKDSKASQMTDQQNEPNGIQSIPSYDPPKFDEIVSAEVKSESWRTHELFVEYFLQKCILRSTVKIYLLIALNFTSSNALSFIFKTENICTKTTQCNVQRDIIVGNRIRNICICIFSVIAYLS